MTQLGTRASQARVGSPSAYPPYEAGVRRERLDPRAAAWRRAERTESLQPPEAYCMWPAWPAWDELQPICGGNAMSLYVERTWPVASSACARPEVMAVPPR